MEIYNNHWDHLSINELQVEKNRIRKEWLTNYQHHIESIGKFKQDLKNKISDKKYDIITGFLNENIIQEVSYYERTGSKNPAPFDIKKKIANFFARHNIQDKDQIIEQFYDVAINSIGQHIIDRKKIKAIDFRIQELENYPEVWKTVKELSTILQNDSKQIPLRTLLINNKDNKDDSINEAFNALKPQEARDYIDKQRYLNDVLSKTDKPYYRCMYFLPEVIGREEFFSDMYTANHKKMHKSNEFKNKWPKLDWFDMNVEEKFNYLKYIRESKNPALVIPKKHKSSTISLDYHYFIYTLKGPTRLDTKIYNNDWDYLSLNQLQSEKKSLIQKIRDKNQEFLNSETEFLKDLPVKIKNKFKDYLNQEINHFCQIGFRAVALDRDKKMRIHLTKFLKRHKIEDSGQKINTFYESLVEPLKNNILESRKLEAIEQRITELEKNPEIWKKAIELSNILQKNSNEISLRALLRETAHEGKTQDFEPITSAYMRLDPAQKKEFNTIRIKLKKLLNRPKNIDSVMDFMSEEVGRKVFFEQMFTTNKKKKESRHYYENWNSLSLFEKIGYLKMSHTKLYSLKDLGNPTTFVSKECINIDKFTQHWSKVENQNKDITTSFSQTNIAKNPADDQGQSPLSSKLESTEQNTEYNTVQEPPNPLLELVEPTTSTDNNSSSTSKSTPESTSDLFKQMSGEAMNRPDKPRRDLSGQATQKRQQSNERQYKKQP